MFAKFEIEHFVEQKGDKMQLNGRQSAIVEFLKTEKRASVKKMANYFNVCEMTIRRDIKELEANGYLQRYNGGAIYLDAENQLPIETRRFLHAKEKIQLSEKAKQYLHDDMSVFIDSSSTCAYIVPVLAEYKKIILITNSIQCLLLASRFHIKTIIAGGILYEHDMCTVGRYTEEFLKNFNIDVGFFSARGISDDGMITDNEEDQLSVRRVVMDKCSKKLFLFDSTKLHQTFIYKLCNSDEPDEIILI